MKSNIFGTGDMKIFRDRSALSPKYLPETLVARDQQIGNIANILKPVLSNGEPKNAFIYGKTGAGKTAVVRYVFRILNEITLRENRNVNTIILNCKQVNSTSHIIFEIIKSIDQDADVPRSGLSIGEYYSILWKVINKSQSTIILVFDEIDQLKDHNVLYNLSRASENMNIENGLHIGIIGISNDLFFSEKLDPRVISSLNKRDFVFPPYNIEQISLILNDRIELAFEEGVVDKEAVEQCSIIASQEDGDARKALALLDTAGEITERNSLEKITKEHVLLAHEELNKDCFFEIIESLPVQSKLMLASIVQLIEELNDKVTTGQVEVRYKELAGRNDLRILGRSSVSRIIAEFDMLGIINAPVRSKGRFGKTRLISIDENMDKLKEVLYSDYRLLNK
ncbi:Cdc6/Cdc18 family protein [Methanolobus bombayensis]|uniref:Cdc6/Cdc18 family protein n=1 Tax=Methanolobus bombayensis TaxID=38023 RepID=UPI001AE564D4|nr:AAA family ATPase [Methanolobus bombayensis]MBP1908592.1 cell division control protein 6 [Methanolobus bombayensis]